MMHDHLLVLHGGVPIVIIKVAVPYVISSVLDRYAAEYAIERERFMAIPFQVVEIRNKD